MRPGSKPAGHEISRAISTETEVPTFRMAIGDGLASNKPLGDGVAPDRSRVRNEFPYFGEPYTRSEQAGATPVPRPTKK